MINNNRKTNNYSLKTEFEIDELKEKIREIKPQTKLGKNLIKLSLNNLESNMSVINADEILNELGRKEYE